MTLGLLQVCELLLGLSMDYDPGTATGLLTVARAK